MSWCRPTTRHYYTTGDDIMYDNSRLPNEPMKLYNKIYETKKWLHYAEESKGLLPLQHVPWHFHSNHVIIDRVRLVKRKVCIQKIMSLCSWHLDQVLFSIFWLWPHKAALSQWEKMLRMRRLYIRNVSVVTYITSFIGCDWSQGTCASGWETIPGQL